MKFVRGNNNSNSNSNSNNNSNNANHSETHRLFRTMQSQCGDHIRRLLEVMNSSEESISRSYAGLSKGALVERQVQKKNECFARVIAPSSFEKAQHCISDPNRANQGECTAQLEKVSGEVKAFWEKTMNSEAQEMLQKYSNCMSQNCSEKMQKQMECVRASGPMAATYCKEHIRAAEQCLGGCLEPPALVAYQECMQREKEHHKCLTEHQGLQRARLVFAKNTLLKMGFEKQELSLENVDVLMDLTGSIISFAFVEQTDFV